MKRLLISAFFAFSVLFAADAQKLVILHTNDTHSHIQPIRTGKHAGLGGVERRLQYIDSIRNLYGRDRVLLLDAGDYDQGTPYFTLARG